MKPSALLVASTLLTALATTAANADAPSYSILDLGVVGDATISQGINVSPDARMVVGRAAGSTYQAFSWTAASGMTALPNLSGRNFAVANSVNNAGVVVGTSSTSFFNSNALPVIWQQGAVSQLALPSGQSTGQATSINASGLIVGAVNSGTAQRAAIFGTGAGSSSIITATTSNGSFMTSALAVNDAGIVIGNGIDPSNRALSVGLIYDSNTGVMSSIGTLPGGTTNGAILFGISGNGHMTGVSTINQGSSTPFIWSAAGGWTAVAPPAGTTNAGLRGVNDSGWAVGTASNGSAIPYLYADGTSYTLASLLPANSGWDFLTNTTAAALAITNDGTIIGTALHNGETHAYQMLLSPVPEPASYALMLGGLIFISAWKIRRQRG